MVSSEGALDMVESHFCRVPGPPRICSCLAIFVSSSGSAIGLIELSDGCLSVISKGGIDFCKERALSLASENASDP